MVKNIDKRGNKLSRHPLELFELVKCKCLTLRVILGTIGIFRCSGRKFSALRTGDVEQFGFDFDLKKYIFAPPVFVHPAVPQGSHREVYQEFRPSYDIFGRSGAKGCSDHRFRAHPQPTLANF